MTARKAITGEDGPLKVAELFAYSVLHSVEDMEAKKAAKKAPR